MGMRQCQSEKAVGARSACFLCGLRLSLYRLAHPLSHHGCLQPPTKRLHLTYIPPPLTQTLQAYAVPYAFHPDYQQALLSVGGRKLLQLTTNTTFPMGDNEADYKVCDSQPALHHTAKLTALFESMHCWLPTHAACAVPCARCG